MSPYDAVILGGGPAGSSTAYFLARAGWRVALVEKSGFPRRKVCGEFLSATSRPLLDAMGVGDDWVSAAGPPIARVGLYARNSSFSAPMPFAAGSGGWGRAFSRASLDLLLLQAAANAGVHVWQPWRAVSLAFSGDAHRCLIQSEGRSEELYSRVLIAAHGSWETGDLSTQPKYDKSPSDLLAFKMLFRSAEMDDDLMPLVAFPGGYGGMARADMGLVGLSCCIRRDVLQERRQYYGASTAGSAVLQHICATTRPVADALCHALQEGSGLSAGPIRPGVRPRFKDHIFRVGNAMGEAHPVIAEGISMALQGGGLLATALIAAGSEGLTAASLQESGRAYGTAWGSLFRPRIAAASLFAKLAMTSGGTTLMVAAVKAVPSLLTMCAGLSGKTWQAHAPAGNIRA